MSLSATSIGIGLRHPHYRQVLEERPALDFLEVHSENFFHAGGASLHVLEQARAHYPISLHGVGLSLASADRANVAAGAAHLQKLKQLVERIQPTLVSEHLCWGRVDGKHFNDLLPFPYTEAALELLVTRVDQVQNSLKRPILIENLSAYLQFKEAQMDEFSFLKQLAQRTGCGILLDVNNLYVNSCNFDYDPWPLLQTLTAANIGEIHLAGHTQTADGLIDTHSTAVCDAVWALYQRTLEHFGSQPTLIEWDTDIPALEVLLQQAQQARQKQSAATQCTTIHPLPDTAQSLSPPPQQPIAEDAIATVHQAQARFGQALLSSQSAPNALALFIQPQQVALDRLAIYRGNVVAAITKALQAAYPVIERIVGEEFFAALARAYWQQHPSEEGDLYCYGASFADFVAHFPHTQQFPYLPDVARLEWAAHQAYGAADVSALHLSALIDRDANQLGTLRFEFHPAVHLLHSLFPIATIWQQHQTNDFDEISIDLSIAEYALIRRQNDRVCVESISHEIYVFLSRLQAQHSLQEAALAVLEHTPYFALDQALATSFNQQLFIALRRENHDQ